MHMSIEKRTKGSGGSHCCYYGEEGASHLRGFVLRPIESKGDQGMYFINSKIEGLKQQF